MSRTSRVLQGFCLLSIGVLVGRWTAAIDTVSAQVPSKKPAAEVLIGTVPVRIGDLGEATLNTLRKQYEVSDAIKIKVRTLGEADVFAVTAKQPPSVLGNVTVREGRVIDVSRAWVVDTSSEVLMSFFQKLYGAFESASSETQMGVLICRTYRDPDGITAMVQAEFNGRNVVVTLIQKESDGKPLFHLLKIEEGVSDLARQDEVPFRVKLP